MRGVFWVGRGAFRERVMQGERVGGWVLFGRVIEIVVAGVMVSRWGVVCGLHCEGGRVGVSLFQVLGRCGTRECLFWFCRFGIGPGLLRGRC